MIVSMYGMVHQLGLAVDQYKDHREFKDHKEFKALMVVMVHKDPLDHLALTQLVDHMTL